MRDMSEKWLELIRLIREEILGLCDQAQKRLDISERELERRMGVSQSTLAQLRQRPDVIPNLKNVAKIAVFMRPRDLPSLLKQKSGAEVDIPDFDKEVWDSLYFLYKGPTDPKEHHVLRREVADLLRLAKTLGFHHEAS